MEFHRDLRPLCSRQIVFPHIQACELSAQLELQSQKSLQLEALNKEMGQTVTSLSARLATPGAGHTTTAPEEKQYLSLLLEVSSCSICICGRRCVHLWLRSRLLGVLSRARGSLC